MYITHTTYTHTHTYYMCTICEHEYYSANSRRVASPAIFCPPRRAKEMESQPATMTKTTTTMTTTTTLLLMRSLLCSRAEKRIQQNIWCACPEDGTHSLTHTHRQASRECFPFRIELSNPRTKKTNFIWGKTHQISRAGVAIIIFHSTCM